MFYKQALLGMLLLLIENQKSPATSHEVRSERVLLPLVFLLVPPAMHFVGLYPFGPASHEQTSRLTTTAFTFFEKKGREGNRGKGVVL